MNRAPSAVFSSCTLHGINCPAPSCSGRLYRYYLQWPTGLDNDRVALGVFANPSTADAEKLDPTLTRWLKFCKSWGYGRSATVNVRAWRATDPKDVPDDWTAVGVENESHILSAARRADIVVLGYGRLGGNLGLETARMIIRELHPRQVYCIRTNGDGTPSHPLYLPAHLQPRPWHPQTGVSR